MTTMTGAKYVEAYAGVEDKNGVKVKDWAIQAEPGFVRCSTCPGVKLKMLKGKGSLTQRSESGKHKGNVGDKKKVGAGDLLQYFKWKWRQEQALQMCRLAGRGCRDDLQHFDWGDG